MSEFNFQSSICTSKEQSERLLALGLKKETADMCSVIDHVSDGSKWEEVDTIFSFTPDDWNFRESVTPRWSLHRLLSLLPKEIPCEVENGLGMYLGKRYAISYFGVLGYYTHENLYDVVILCIEDVIKEGYFNKEYLV